MPCHIWQIAVHRDQQGRGDRAGTYSLAFGRQHTFEFAPECLQVKRLPQQGKVYGSHLAASAASYPVKKANRHAELGERVGHRIALDPIQYSHRARRIQRRGFFDTIFQAPAGTPAGPTTSQPNSSRHVFRASLPQSVSSSTTRDPNPPLFRSYGSEASSLCSGRNGHE